MGGKVLIPTQQHISTLSAARLAADVVGVDTIIVARTDALGANLITSDVDERDREFLSGGRSSEGFFYTEPGLATPIKRSLAYAPYCDLIWCETSTPDLDEARQFAEAIHAEFPDKLLAYNCSPSFNWSAALDDSTIAKFQKELGSMGYAFQFITLAGWHALNASAFELAHGYNSSDMSAYVELQQREFDMEGEGYTATRHQREVGAGYFDDVANGDLRWQIVNSGTQGQHRRTTVLRVLGFLNFLRSKGSATQRTGVHTGSPRFARVNTTCQSWMARARKPAAELIK